MRLRLALLLLVVTTPVIAQTPADSSDAFISPSRPVPVGKAPTMQAKLVKDTPGEQLYSIIFFKDDEVLSGLTDFAIAHKVSDAHFTAIGAVIQIPKRSISTWTATKLFRSRAPWLNVKENCGRWPRSTWKGMWQSHSRFPFTECFSPMNRGFRLKDAL